METSEDGPSVHCVLLCSHRSRSIARSSDHPFSMMPATNVTELTKS